MSTLSIIFLLVGIHVFELFIFLGYRLIQKNTKLYKTIESQQQYIDTISIIINNSTELLDELDIKGHFKADDEVGIFFKNLQEIQLQLDKFNLTKK